MMCADARLKELVHRAKLAEAHHSAAQAVQQQIADDAQAALHAEEQEAAELFGGNGNEEFDNLPPGVHFDENGNLAAETGNDAAFAFVLQPQELALHQALNAEFDAQEGMNN